MLFWNDQLQAKLEELIERNERGTIEGVYEDLPIEVYHHPQCPGFSKTDLDYASNSFEHLASYKARRIEEYKDPEAEPSRALVFGAAFHDALFTPQRYADVYIQEPDESDTPQVPDDINRRTKQGKIDYEAWVREKLSPWLQEREARFKGKVRMKADEIDQLKVMKAKAEAHPTFQSILEGSKKEITIFWRDPKTGILLKTRPDVLNVDHAICLDAKTTEDASPVAFRRTIANFFYDKQAAMQVDGIKAAFGKACDFVFSAHEEKDPHGIALYRLDDACIEVGRTLYCRDVEYISKCLKDRAVPRGYPTDIVSIGLPAWAFDITSR